jgi:PPE-repeat protein
MWANNSAAMSRYQAESAQAATLPLFSSPPSIADPSGVAAQASAVSAPAAAAPASAVAPPLSPLDALLQSLGITFDPNQGWFGLANAYANQAIAGGLPVNILGYLAQSRAAQALQSVGGSAGTGLSQGEEALGAGPGALGAFGSAGLSAETTAAVRVGVSLGKLTAPPAVVGLLPTSHVPVQLAAAATPLTEAASSGFPLPPLMPPPISAGSGWRKRKQQKYEEDEDPEYEDDEGPTDGSEAPPAPLGTGWRKRRDYEDIAYGVELPGTVMKTPPSAG